MHHEFCTLFDVNYLPRALVLHESLRAIYGEALPGVMVIGLAELEAHDTNPRPLFAERTASRTCSRVVTGYRGQTTHSTELTLADLGAAAARHGRGVVRSFAVEGRIRSFILARGDG